MGFLNVEIQDREMFKEADTRIKLFGKTIQLLEIPPLAVDEVGGTDRDQSCDATDDVSSILDRPCSSNSEIGDITTSGMDTDEEGSTKDLSSQKQENSDVKDDAQPLTSEELKGSSVTCPANDDSNAQSTDNYAATMKSSKTGDEPSETSTSQEKTLKKPDKIVPCPRCNSMDTKFCYFNNYNITQHRHFCKKCQRYWTAGGTMRSMPVGAGRRKNKNAAAHYRYQMDSEALQNARVDLPNGIHQPASNPYGTVDLAFNGDYHLSGLSDSAANSNQVGKSQVPCFPGALFPYPWNSLQWRAQVSTSAYGPSSFPVPFYPTAPFWGCPVPDPCNVSWVVPPTSHNHTPLGSGPDSSTLGKHSRDDNTLKPASNYEKNTKGEGNCEKRLWVPKTLRIDDPEEAAMSSIWATLGITNERVDSFGGPGILNAFQRLSKDDEKKTHVSETSTVLRANPAALSRSLNFHESS